MAALFPIPYDTDPGRSRRVGERHDHRRGGCEVIALDARARRRLAIRRRNVGFVAAVAASVVVTLLGLGSVFAVIDALSQPAPPAPVSTAVGGAAADSVVVVQSGDTLTSIARDLQPAGDITALVDELAAQHGPAPLHPGERLVVGDAVRAATDGD